MSIVSFNIQHKFLALKQKSKQERKKRRIEPKEINGSHRRSVTYTLCIQSSFLPSFLLSFYSLLFSLPNHTPIQINKNTEKIAKKKKQNLLVE